MSDTRHLRRRGNAYYLHRRVPLDLVKRYGKPLVTYSLGTSDLKVARKKRDIENLKLDQQFEQLRTTPSAKPISIKSLSIPFITGLVQDYVARAAAHEEQRSLTEPGPTSEEEGVIREELDTQKSALKNGDNPNGLQWTYGEGSKILGYPPGALDPASALPFVEMVRRGLLELVDRKLLRLDSDFSKPFVNPMFSPQARVPVTFGEVAEQYLASVLEEATANDTSGRWIDQQRANVALLRTIVRRQSTAIRSGDPGFLERYSILNSSQTAIFKIQIIVSAKNPLFMDVPCNGSPVYVFGLSPTQFRLLHSHTNKDLTIRNRVPRFCVPLVPLPSGL